MVQQLEQVRDIVRKALEEDIGSGDITTLWTVKPSAAAKAVLMAKDPGVIAGMDIAELAFHLLDEHIHFAKRFQDGHDVEPGVILAEVQGPAQAILSGERTAINFVQQLSGIATLTARYVRAVRNTKAKITDTRKTTPGLRVLEKYAVRVGGGLNHRAGLYDMVLIKENHILAAGGIAEAAARVREGLRRDDRPIKVVIETKDLAEVKEALDAQPDRIMLDNMPIDRVREAIVLINSVPPDKRPEVEASGRIALDSVQEIAETGVDFISVGALTHSVKALDVSLLFV